MPHWFLKSLTRSCGRRLTPAHRKGSAKRFVFKPHLDSLECRWLPTVSVTGQSLSFTEAVATPATVATFTSNDQSPQSAANYSAAIDWGDGQNSPGTIQPNSGGGFDVLGSHAYSAPGNYTVAVQIADLVDSTTASANSTAAVLAPTDTAVQALTDQSVYGQDVTYTVNVTSSGNPVMDGTVSVLEGGTALADPVTLDANGQATFDLASLPVTDNPHNLDFVYSGTSEFDVSSGTASLAVTPAPLTITVQDVTKTAGDPAPDFAVDYSGFVLGEDASVLTGTLNFDPADSNTAGIYPVTASGLSSPNYDITYVPGNLNVLPGPATALVTTGLPDSASAGSPLSLTVTAVDAYGNTATDYQGTVTFSSSDPQAQLPDDYTFTSDDQGSHTFAVTLATAGDQTVSAADTQDATLTQTSDPVAVTPADASVFQLSAPASAIVGTPFDVTITVQDAYGNIVPDYAGTVHWSASNPGDLLPADYTFTSDDQGSHTFASQFALRVAGDDTLTATDLGAGTISADVVVSGTEPSQEIAVIGPDGQVYLDNPTTAGNDTPSYRLAVAGQVQAVSIAHDAHGRPEVFALGMDNQVWALQLDDAGVPQGAISSPRRARSNPLSSARTVTATPSYLPSAWTTRSGRRNSTPPATRPVLTSSRNPARSNS
jgi:hypothetical protein